MYQQHNNNLFYPNYGAALAQNQNTVLMNNQLQYQRQLNPQQQQNLQRNQQIQLQNAQLHQIQNNQVLKPQQIHQPYQAHQHHQQHNIQNVQNLQKLQPNPNQKYHNVQANPTYIPKQVLMDNKKTYNQPQLQKNQVNNPKTVNQMPVQNIQQQTNKPQVLRAQAKDQRVLLASSHLNLGQTPTLEQVQVPAPTHVPTQIAMPDQKKLLEQQKYHQAYQNQPQMKIEQKPYMENLKNTAIVFNNNQNNENKNKAQTNIQAGENQTKKSATLMTVNSLANIPYNEYPIAEYSNKPFFNICGYGSNSYNGKIKDYNEDMNKNIVNFQKKVAVNNSIPNISYFGIFDGHGGDKCSKFLKDNLDKFLFNSPNFPANPIESIRNAFKTAEYQFYQTAVQNGKLVDRSGSCALIALIINDVVYAINLGDSRALYSRDGGKEYYQITRDHKPNDEKERNRIEKAGGKVYYANKTYINGKEVTLKEEQYGKGFTFPYRLEPSGLAVSFFI